MTLTEILGIIIIHWFADFLMQDEKWAINKSKDNNALLDHVLNYSLIWFYAVFFLLSFDKVIIEKSFESISLQWLLTYSLLFAQITFVAHFITDYFTSRIVSKMFAQNKYGSSIPNFGAFTMIGIDQVLHYIQLFCTYQFINQ
jgi:hypothetical protein